jgi:arylformamidase
MLVGYWEGDRSLGRRMFIGGAVSAALVPALTPAQELSNGDDPNWAAMSRDARDAAYNCGKAVSDSAQIVDGWIKASATFRARNAKHLDLAYGPGERNKWDLFPAHNSKAPCLIFIHGGYWQARNREHCSCFAEGVRGHGWAAAFPGYTLAPAVTLTQIVDEMRNAFWRMQARSQSAEGVKAHRLYVASILGFLALMTKPARDGIVWLG